MVLFSIDSPIIDVNADATRLLYIARPDGQRFLVASRAPAANTPPIRVILNWQALLKQQ